MKYVITSSLFLCNNEIISWIALLILFGMAVADFVKAAEREARNR